MMESLLYDLREVIRAIETKGRGYYELEYAVSKVLECTRLKTVLTGNGKYGIRLERAGNPLKLVVFQGRSKQNQWTLDGISKWGFRLDECMKWILEVFKGLLAEDYEMQSLGYESVGYGEYERRASRGTFTVRRTYPMWKDGRTVPMFTTLLCRDSGRTEWNQIGGSCRDAAVSFERGTVTLDELVTMDENERQRMETI